MNDSLIDRLNPVARRTLRSVQSNLAKGTAAIYLGAGVDTQLAKDADPLNKIPTWAQLLTDLGAFPEQISRQLEPYANGWPTETAMAARIRLGDFNFKEQIGKKTNCVFEPNPDKPFTAALVKLLRRTNVIVTTNYSSHALRAMTNAIREKKRNTEIVVVTREDLPSFCFPPPERKPERIFLVHIHGRCIEGSDLVFDAWGYNVAVNDDPYYQRFLNDLFSQRNVISIGTSWADIPLRNQAALVYRSKRYQQLSHVAVHYHGESASPTLDPVCAYREWSNAMHAAYGVRMIPVNDCTQAGMLETLASGSTECPDANGALKDIADFLDTCGDYESPVQQNWLLSTPASSPNCSAKTVWQFLYDRLLTIVADPSFWKQIARIEQHLRHFHYLYADRNDEGHFTDKRHERLWDALAQHAQDPSLYANLEQIDDKIKFGFLVGQYELYEGERSPVISNPASFRITEQIYKDRLRLSERIWIKELESADRVCERTSELLDVGWESMAAKLLLDAADTRAEKQGHDPIRLSREILELAKRGGDVARSTGYFRREVKAEVISALWHPDPQESRIRILSKIRAAEFLTPGKVSSSATAGATPDAAGQIEPGLNAALVAGLLGSHVRSLRQHITDDDTFRQRVRESVVDLFAQAGLKWRLAPKWSLDFWWNRLERRLQNDFGWAISELEKIKQRERRSATTSAP